MEIQHAHIAKYLAIFAACLVATMVSVGLLSYFLDFTPPRGMTVVIHLVAIYVTSEMFVRDHKRLPNKTEKRKLVWGSFFLAIVISLFLTLATFYVTDLGFENLSALLGKVHAEIDLWIIGVMAVVILIAYFTVTHFCYHFLTKIALKQYRDND